MDAPFTLMLTLLLLSSVFSVDIYPGSTLYASNLTRTWTSPNENFSVGFIADGSTHYAAVTYNGIPVWKAGGNDKGGGAVDSSASLRFLADGNSASSTDPPAPSCGSPTPPAAVSSLPPSTTLVTFSGNLTLRWNNYVVDWSLGLRSSLNNVNLTSPSLSLESNGTLSVFDPSLSSPVVMAYSSDYAEGSGIHRFLRLDSDGNLRIYSSAKETGKITERWAAVTNQCLVFGYCGDVGICSFNDSGPICGCPSPDFDPIEPNNRRKGCLVVVVTQEKSKIVGIFQSIFPSRLRLSRVNPILIQGVAIRHKSYGMVLLEVVSGRRSFEVSPETDHKKFYVWAFEEFEKGNVKEIVDKSMVHQEEVNMGQVIRAIQVAFWCIQENPSHRPTMGKVVQMLEGITAIRNPPKPNVVFEEGFYGKNENVSGHDVSVFSTFVDSTRVPSTSSSFRTAQTSSFVLEWNLGRASSSF
ncbi:hypothetical protein Vadar_014412 [Vaccinium darrowii]|uniref:Uncharacterized protein n=1 Tax=Vaccinium darrowii TaxID=229202 RepID=A0ACB7YEM7_9ERIC|nr:hypothetical protein Vadar_014412 [Vaccinium darrowii]